MTRDPFKLPGLHAMWREAHPVRDHALIAVILELTKLRAAMGGLIELHRKEGPDTEIRYTEIRAVIESWEQEYPTLSRPSPRAEQTRGTRSRPPDTPATD